MQDALPLEGAPTSAVLASDTFAGRHAGGQRLYLVETLPGPANEYSDPDSWKLLAIDPLTFEVSARHALSEAPLWLSVAPDGRDAYYAVGGSNAIAHVDLGSGATRRLAALPGSGLGLAVSHERLFVPNPRGDEVWVVERRSGRRLRPIATGRHPIGLTLDG